MRSMNKLTTPTVHFMLSRLLARGYSQADIVRATGVHHSQISRWLAGGPPRYADAVLRVNEMYAATLAAPKAAP